MILTEEQAKDRLGSPNNLVNRFGKVPEGNVIEIFPIKRPGNHEGEGVKEIHEEIKVEIASRARLGETQISLAREFGVAETTVNHLEHGGYMGGRGRVNEALVESRMNEIQDVAMCKLLKSLGFLNDEKLSKMSGKDLSAVAANMAKVAGSVRPQVTDNNNVHLHLYAPELRKESSFKTIEVHG